MGKVVAKVGVIVGAVALVATGVGAIALPGVVGALTIGGISTSALLAAGAALQVVGQMLTKKPSLSPSTTDRLNASLVTDAPRKIVFGHTALNTDLRYQEWWGREQEYCSQVFVLASHWCESVDELWLDDKLAWTAAGGVTGEFVGYLVVQVYAQAGSGSVYRYGWSNRWGAGATFNGCATMYLQFKVTGNGKKGKSPFTSQITSRVTVVGKGARLPDPRFDGTVGGSGDVRVADQATWQWAPAGHEAGRNPALALLFYLIGWRIQNPATGEWKLAVGCGVPVDRIDLGSFMTAANMCDEQVMRADGSYEPRYRCDGTFSAADDPSEVFATLEAAMNAKLRDSVGRFSLQVLHNDLATPVVEFTDDDVLGDFTWSAGNDLNKGRNVVRGRLTDPLSLYQLIDFPAVRIPSPDGIERIDSVDFALVQSQSQAQRLAKQRLQRAQYQGAFAAEFNARGWAVKDGDPVTLTFSALGFNRKRFRVAEGVVDPTGVVPLVLVEEHEAIYAWDRGESAGVQAAEPNTFDPLLLPIIAAIDDAGRTAEWPAITGEGKPDDDATNSADLDSPFGPDGTVRDYLHKVGQLAGAIEILADTPDPDALFEGVKALVDNIQAQAVAALADQLLGEARQKRNDALLHLDGVPLGPVVKKVDRTSQERDEVLAESISLVKASGETTLGLLDAEVFRLDQARISDLGAEALAISSVRADAQTLVDGVARHATGEIERVEKASGDATKAAASAAEAITARFETAQGANIGDIRRLDAVVATEKDVTATSFAAIEAVFDGRVKAQSAHTEQAFASEQEARVQALDTLRADMATTIGGEATRYTAETQRLESNLVDKDSAQSTALQSTRAELMLDTELGRALMDAIVRRLEQATVDEQGARATSVEQVRAEVAGVAGEVTVQKAAIVDMQGRVKAYLLIEVEAGTGRAVARFAADDIDGSTIDFSANRLRFANPVDGKSIVAMQIAGNNVEITHDLLLGAGCIIARSATHMLVHGTGFGSAGQFLEWYGPIKGDLSECTEAQAIRYTKTDGTAYSAGLVAEGQLRNQKTSFDYGLSSVAVGPFVTNGKLRKYVASLAYDASGTRWSSYRDEGPVTATFVLERLKPDGSWQFLEAGQLGNYNYDDGGNGGIANESEPARYSKSASGTVEVDDTTGGTDPIQLRVRVTAFNAPGVTGTAYQPDKISQVLQVVSYEP